MNVLVMDGIVGELGARRIDVAGEKLGGAELKSEL
jgi:hypothetical protein